MAVRGFTLIEILVVIIIVSIITVVAVLAFGHFGRGRREKLILEQFARVIPIAQEQAILTPVVLGLHIDAQGYHFLQYDILFAGRKDAWKPMRDTVLSNPRAFKNLFKIDKTKSIIAKELLFLPSGFVTPFVLTLKGASHTYTMSVKNNGAVDIK